MSEKSKLVEFTKEEVLEYLEYMVAFDAADEIEEDMFYSIKWTNKYKKSQLTHVLTRMKDLYTEQNSK